MRLRTTFEAISRRSTFIPPDVEPAQPHITEQNISNTIANGVHVLVSTVAKPDVVDILTTWNDAWRNASPKLVYMFDDTRLTAITKEMTNIIMINVRTTSERKILLRLPVNVAYRTPKCIADRVIAAIIIPSIAGLSQNATELFLVLNPHVPHEVIAWLIASNHVMPLYLSAKVVITVKPTYMVIRMRKITFVR